MVAALTFSEFFLVAPAYADAMPVLHAPVPVANDTYVNGFDVEPHGPAMPSVVQAGIDFPIAMIGLSLFTAFAWAALAKRPAAAPVSRSNMQPSAPSHVPVRTNFAPPLVLSTTSTSHYDITTAADLHAQLRQSGSLKYVVVERPDGYSLRFTISLNQHVA